VNSHWQLKAATDKFCERGEPIKCGDIIRLEHLTTKRNLHSHHFASPLSLTLQVEEFWVVFRMQIKNRKTTFYDEN